MKKEYNSPELEIITLLSEEVLTTSGDYTFDPDGILKEDPDGTWFN